MEDDPEQPDQVTPPKRVGNKRNPFEYIPGQHEPLYSVHLWRQNQQLRKNKAPHSVSTRKKWHSYPLTGIAKCWECWQWEQRPVNLRGSTGGKGIPYYRCATMHDRYKQRNRPSKGAGAVPLATIGLEAKSQSDMEDLRSRHHSLRQDQLWPQVLSLLEHFTIPATWHNRILAYYLSDEGLSDFEWQGHNLRRKLNRLRNLYLEGFLTLADFEARALETRQQLDILKPASQPQTQAVRSRLRNFGEIWQELGAPEQRSLLKVCFAGLYFDGQGQLRRVQAHAPFDEFFQ
jgi:hypothetical protein